MKLGRKPFIEDKRDLLYGSYNKGALPPVPAAFGHQNMIPANGWGVLGNDSVGDCVIAGSDHETMLWTNEGGNAANFTAENAISDYSAITGYDPLDPSTDQGTNVREALLYRQQKGMVDSGGKRHKIGAFLLLDQTNINEVLEAMYLFSAIGIGINFPQSAMDQFNARQPWSLTDPKSPILGGHYVPCYGYDGRFYCVTWGKIQPMTVAFFQQYCEEAWVCLSLEFLNDQGVSPEGFNLAQLQADLAALKYVPKPTALISD